jgi:hypothetical protein
VNRLRFLAHEGLMAQHWMEQGLALAPQIQLPRAEATNRINVQAARQTNQAFDLPEDGEGDA